MVGTKGARGLPGPPGKCSCGALSNVPYDDFSSRGHHPKVPAVRKYSCSSGRYSRKLERNMKTEGSASLMALFRSSL